MLPRRFRLQIDAVTLGVEAGAGLRQLPGGVDQRGTHLRVCHPLGVTLNPRLIRSRWMAERRSIDRAISCCTSCANDRSSLRSSDSWAYPRSYWRTILGNPSRLRR
jgi:hypothetical protein